jgi:6-phosphofructokinase 2
MIEILTVTMNPAIDIATRIARLTSGRKLRCDEPRLDPGGGGVNVSRAIKELGGKSTSFIAVGGMTGDLLVQLLAEHGIDPICFAIDGLTRQSFAVLEDESGQQYRFVLPGPKWPDSLWQEALVEMAKLARDTKYIIVSGSLPPGIPDDFHASLTAAVGSSGAHVVLDTSGPALKAAVSPGKPEIHCIRMKMAFAQGLVNRHAASIVIVTSEQRGALLATRDEAFRIGPGPRTSSGPAVMRTASKGRTHDRNPQRSTSVQINPCRKGAVHT